MKQLPKITLKQQEILLLIYKYRFLNRIQIQAFLSHKYPKRINDWLRDLTAKEYLGRIYSTDFGENTKPAIYFMGINGIRFLKTQDGCSPEVIQKLYREKNRQESFIERSVFIAECCLSFLKLSRQTAGLSYGILTESGLADPESSFNFLSAYGFQLSVTKHKGKQTSQFLMAYFEPTLPKYRVRKRIKTWLDGFYFSNDWEDATGEPFPGIYAVCPTKALMISAKRLARSVLEDRDSDGLNISFTYEGLVRKEGVTGEVWERV